MEAERSDGGGSGKVWECGIWGGGRAGKRGELVLSLGRGVV